MSNIINVQGLKKYFYSQDTILKVLDGISFSLKAGETAAITGESGSGKSTFLNLLGGLDNVTEGDIFINNKNITTTNEKILSQMRNKHIGFVFQNHNLLIEFSAIENIIIPYCIYNKNWIEALEKAEKLMKEVGILNRKHHKVGELSGGEMQRVSLARAMITDPDIILADEPTGNLDEKNSSFVADKLISLSKEQKTAIVLVTHSKNIASKCEYQYSLTHGMLSKAV
jgi:lipoprotein-releasing system ATP-binding protein